MGKLGTYVARAVDSSGLYAAPVRRVELVEYTTYSFWEELGLPIPYWRAKVSFMDQTAVSIKLGVFSHGWMAYKMVDWWIRNKKRDRRRDRVDAARKAKWEYRSDVES